MSKMFTIKASEAHGRRLNPEYRHALRRTRIKSSYPTAKLLSLSYFRLRNWFLTDLYEHEGNKISSCGILGGDVLCASMSTKGALFVCGSQTAGKVFGQKM